jgi:hypothetical protein
MPKGEVQAGIETGLVDGEVTTSAGNDGFKAALDLVIRPELRDLFTGAGGAALAAFAGPWAAPALIGAGLSLFLYRRQKAKKEPGGP